MIRFAAVRASTEERGSHWQRVKMLGFDDF
jgi:hypothetical protein